MAIRNSISLENVLQVLLEEDNITILLHSTKVEPMRWITILGSFTTKRTDKTTIITFKSCSAEIRFYDITLRRRWNHVFIRGNVLHIHHAKQYDSEKS